MSERCGRCGEIHAFVALCEGDVEPHETVEYWKARYIEVRREQGVMEEALEKMEYTAQKAKAEYSITALRVERRLDEIIAIARETLDATETDK